MFDSIARRYDLANHLLSGGIDFYWRRRAAQLVARWQPKKVLDLAAGTGDLSLAIAKQLPEAEITCADFSAEMLEIARSKGLSRTVVADALQLPFADETFDCATVAFGLRNMEDWGRAIQEMSRVLIWNGRVVILEFSLPTTAPVRSFYRLYLHHFLPALAAIITGQKDAYAYLGASIEKFPSGSDMVQLLEANGFTGATALPLTGGIATIYTAEKAGGAPALQRLS